jgi:hypothetical protein
MTQKSSCWAAVRTGSANIPYRNSGYTSCWATHGSSNHKAAMAKAHWGHRGLGMVMPKVMQNRFSDFFPGCQLLIVSRVPNGYWVLRLMRLFERVINGHLQEKDF